MSLKITDLETDIQQAKQRLKAQCVNLESSYIEFSNAIEQDIAEIVKLRDAGESVVPEVDFHQLFKEGMSAEQQSLIRKRGCVVVRNTFPRTQAEDWNERLASYLENNGYDELEDSGLDNYFSALQDGKPQIFDIYWSKPQIEARQSKSLAIVRQELNRLWKVEFNGSQVFDPDRQCAYADRIRRREPADASLGLKPHVDGGTVERWLDTRGYQQVYRYLISGKWQQYDPFDAAYRTQTEEIPSPAVCSMFRTYQGWTALTAQGPGAGTLQLIPLARGLGWMFLRALQDDISDSDLCGVMPGRALQCDPEFHALLMHGLSSIPKMKPGDTIWWHPDVVHGVEQENSSNTYSNVMYIGSAPYCSKNAEYLPRQAACFETGASAPDFAAVNAEEHFDDRATLADLTELGRKQMGMEPW